MVSKVVRFYELGGPEVLKIEEGPVRAPGAGEVRIAVQAIGLNRAEAMIRRGQYIERPTLPSGLGFEAAGHIDAVGEGVTDFSAGDPVSVIPPSSQVAWPTYGSFACVPAHLVVKLPPELGFVQGAALWMAYVTAYGALIDNGKVQKGDKVVVTAASSSVGLAAIEILKKIGAVAIAVTRSRTKEDALLKAGASAVIVLERDSLSRRLRELAGGDGFQLVFDPVGGHNFTALMPEMAERGSYICYGTLSDQPAEVPLLTMLGKSLSLRGYVLHELTADPKKLALAKEFILDGVRSGALHPKVDRTFSFDEIEQAHAYLESNKQVGKIVVTI